MRPQLFTNENSFDKEFLKVQNETGVPISILKGFVALESGFNPKAYRYEPHRKDASYGLAQVLYQTAKGFGFKGRPDELFNPYLSLKYGALFIKSLMKKYDIMDMIASYNMGYPRKASNTTNIIKQIYGNPQPDWKYANQPYVDKVSAYISFYQMLEKNDINGAWEVYNLIKQKNYRKASSKLFQPYIPVGIEKYLPLIFLTLPVGLALTYLYRRIKND